MQIKALTLNLFACGVVTEASIHFEPAFQVARQRTGNQQEQEREHQQNILNAASYRQRTGQAPKGRVIGCEQKHAPFYELAMMLPLSSAKNIALRV